ncbi:MAG: hypothetical protein KAT17_05590 [Candidatus Aminicenantes bacterium]|nr:hypothetical protein [Candidatus Aminicenantes bacterium]
MDNPKGSGLEQLIVSLDRRIEDLKIKFNLFFSGELNIPPEKERGDIEKQIRNILSSEHKSAKLTILIQNIASKFTLYNNMWLKRLYEIEVGIVPLHKKRTNNLGEQPDQSIKQKVLLISLNDENSFEQFYNQYCEMSKNKSQKKFDKEKIINSLKTKMITANLIDAKINIVTKHGKVKISLKS